MKSAKNAQKQGQRGSYPGETDSVELIRRNAGQRCETPDRDERDKKTGDGEECGDSIPSAVEDDIAKPTGQSFSDWITCGG